MWQMSQRNDEWLLALPDEWKHETIGSNMAVLF